MENKTPLSIALFIVLFVGAYCYVLKQELIAYEQAFAGVDAGFREFMMRSVKGKHLYNYVNMDTVGVFKIDGLSIACAGLHTELPTMASRPRRP